MRDKRLYAADKRDGFAQEELIGTLLESGQFELWAFGAIEVEQMSVKLMLLPDAFRLLHDHGDQKVAWGTVARLRQELAKFLVTNPRSIAVTSREGHLPGADDPHMNGLLPLTREATGGRVCYVSFIDADATPHGWQIVHMVTESGIWHSTSPGEEHFHCEPETLVKILSEERSRLTVSRDAAGNIASIGTVFDPTNGRAAHWEKVDERLKKS